MSSPAIDTRAFETPEADIEAPDSDIESDEPEMESSLHLAQLVLLLQCLELHWKERNDFFAAGNMSIFYSEQQVDKESESARQRVRGPDFFVVLGTVRRPRRSWCVWKEGGRYPNLIVEVLSDSTSALDRGLKKQIYQDVFRTPDYVWFDPETAELAGFHLVDRHYEPLAADKEGRIFSAELGLWLGVHEGMLRFFSEKGVLLPSAEELANQNEKLANQNEKLIAKLRALGVDPGSIL